MHRILERQLDRLGLREGPPDAEQWKRFLERVDRAYREAEEDRYTLERALDLSSKEMRERFDQLRAAQAELVLASRKAGMADVATSVLHNVGNVLNSVNVSAGIAGKLASSKAFEGLGKSLALLRAQPQPGRFLDETPKGQKLLAFLDALDKTLSEERATMTNELGALTKHIEHIKAIVSEQLAASRGGKMRGVLVERVNLAELVDDAVEVVRATLAPNQDVVFVREFESIAPCTDRQKVFQIVTNLLSNARDAVAGRSGIIRLATKRSPDGMAAISVTDNGVGIEPVNHARVFVHGFTTKESGHGFGLHSSACAAGELGGKLTVDSDGLGKGATFTLLLPLAAAGATATSASSTIEHQGTS